MTTTYTIHADGFRLHTEQTDTAAAYSKEGYRVTAVTHQ